MQLEFGSFVLAAATSDLAGATARLAADPAVRDHADAVEFRMDMATDPLDALADHDGSLPLIVTNRPTWEGGQADDGPDRLDALERAVEHDAVGAVDLELAALDGSDRSAVSADAVRSVAATARDEDVAVVVSTHDFAGTPDRDRLRERLHGAGGYGDVAKLAVTADGPGDVLDLLSATWAATSVGETVATMAMGSAGRHSRAVTPMYGSRIGYAPVGPADATAPGQYDLATLATLVERLRGENPGERP